MHTGASQVRNGVAGWTQCTLNATERTQECCKRHRWHKHMHVYLDLCRSCICKTLLQMTMACDEKGTSREKKTAHRFEDGTKTMAATLLCVWSATRPNAKLGAGIKLGAHRCSPHGLRWKKWTAVRPAPKLIHMRSETVESPRQHIPSYRIGLSGNHQEHMKENCQMVE